MYNIYSSKRFSIFGAVMGCTVEADHMRQLKFLELDCMMLADTVLH